MPKKNIIILLILLLLIVPLLLGSKGQSDSKSITLTPSSVVVYTGNSLTYTVLYYNPAGKVKNVSNLTTYSISSGAGGFWQENIYTAGNSGLWKVTATYRGLRSIAYLEVLPVEPQPLMLTESEPPMLAESQPPVLAESQPPVLAESPTNEPQPPLVPDPIDGGLCSIFGQVGEYDGMIAFPYSKRGVGYLMHFEDGGQSFDYPIPNADNIYQQRVKVVLTSKTELFLAFGIPIRVNRYSISDKGLTLLDSQTFGDTYSRIVDFIKLKNGNLILAWHEQHTSTDAEGHYGVDVGFACYSGEWYVHPYVLVYRNFYVTNGTLCQHPADDSIWFFSVHDGNHHIKVIHLLESGGILNVDWTNYNFIGYEDPLKPEGEFPWITSCQYDGNILIAYQCDRDDIIYGFPAWHKVAHVNAVVVEPNGNRYLLYELEKRTDRIIEFCVGGLWLAYGAYNESEYDWNDLYLSKNGNEHRYLGELAGGCLENEGVRICYSSDWIIAQMGDGLIHFFRR